MADSNSQRLQGQRGLIGEHGTQGRKEQTGHDTTPGFWDDHEWLLCGDGKIRRIPSAKRRVCELVDGIPNDPLQEHYEGVPIVTEQKVKGRAALLHALGNAIVPTVAERFIRAYLLTLETQGITI